MADWAVYEFLNELEKKIFSWLVKRGVLFTAQEKIFGIGEVGSATLDFVLQEQLIVLRVMGGYWHSGLTPKARDLLGKERLMEAGYMVVDLAEEDLMRRLDFTLEKAIRGEELPR